MNKIYQNHCGCYIIKLSQHIGNSIKILIHIDKYSVTKPYSQQLQSKRWVEYTSGKRPVRLSSLFLSPSPHPKPINAARHAGRLWLRAGRNTGQGKTKRKEKDIKTARDADESGEVYAAKPFFSILRSAMPGELLCHCAGLLSVKRSLDWQAVGRHGGWQA